MPRARKERIQRPPGYYQQQLRQREAGGRRTVNLWLAGTRREVDRELKKWTEYCNRELEEENAEAVLMKADANVFITYFEWFIDQSTCLGLCRSTIRSKWKCLCMKYRRLTGKSMPDDVCRIFQSNIHREGYLVKKYGLNLVGKQKPVLQIEDFLDIMSTLWLSEKMRFPTERMRAQFWLFEHILGYTGSRPGALVDSQGGLNYEPVDEWDHGTAEPELPTYADTKLAFRNIKGRERPEWTLEITLNKTKGGLAKEKPVTYIFHHSDTLALCPITSFLTMAFADRAFHKDTGLDTPETFYTKITAVPDGLEELVVPFSPEMQRTPLFRDAEGKAMPYNTMHRNQVQLGQATGYKVLLSSYCIRRGFGNAIDGQVTEAQRTQAMSHTNPNQYVQSYQSKYIRVDLQNLVLGVPRDDKLVQTCGQMRQMIDPRYPWDLTKAEKAAAAQQSEELCQIQGEIALVRAELIRTFGKLKLAQGSELLRHYEEQKKGAASLLRRLYNDSLREKQEEHIKFTVVDDVHRVIKGLPSTVPTKAASPVFQIPERSLVAEALFSKATVQPGSTEDNARRVVALNSLLVLCQLKTPHHSRVLIDVRASFRESTRLSDAAEESTSSMLAEQMQCDDFENLVIPGSNLEWLASPELHLNLANENESCFQICQKEAATMNAMLCSIGNDRNMVDDTSSRRSTDSIDQQEDLFMTSINKEMPAIPIVLDSSKCLFCYHDSSYGGDRLKNAEYTRADNMRRHARLVHFRKIAKMAARGCPDPACTGQTFKHESHFKNHALFVHDVYF